MTNLELAKEQGNQSAPNVIDAAKASEVQIDVTLAQEQGNQAAPLIADSLASSELYDAIKQQGNQAMPLIVDALVQPAPPAPVEKNPMYFKAVNANSAVFMMSNLETAPNLEYSTDGQTWQSWEYTDQTSEGLTLHVFDTLTMTDVGDCVYFRGDNPNGLSASDNIISMFIIDSQNVVSIGGNIMSIIDKTELTTVVPPFGFCRLFYGMNVTEAKVFNKITKIGEYGFSNFLTDSRVRTIDDFDNLTEIKEHGCSAMFYSCTSLKAAADMPILTIIGNKGCEYMYYNDVHLETPSNLPALTTIGKNGCQQKYCNCSVLERASEMPSLTAIGQDGITDMYLSCTFDTSNDGTTLNFAFPTPPVTVGEDTIATAYNVAYLMGNTNGFEGGGAQSV